MSLILSGSANAALLASYDTVWYGKAIGEPFALRDDIVGVPIPPTDREYRFIKLTYNDAYNTGVLTSQTSTGVAPDVISTAVIALANSPINGRTINLLNTERRIIRAGSSGLLQGDAIRNITGATSYAYGGAGGGSGVLTQTQFSNQPAKAGVVGADPGQQYTISIDVSMQVPTANENRPKNQGVTYYMRIL